MNKYLFQFTPTGAYFFGAENRRVDVMKDKDDTANYYLKSFPFPQQSTILGSIRYFFLQKICPDTVFKNNKIINTDATTGAPAYIGKKSFNIADNQFEFGNIKGISEVFLRKDKQNYLPRPFDKWSNDFGELTQVAETNLYFLPKYDAKNYYSMVFTNGTDNVNFYDIFQEHIQSGNKKSNLGDDDEDGFYKQQYYHLAEGWSFAVELETDLDLCYLNIPLFLPMGGENRLFKIAILPSDFNREAILEKDAHSNLTKVVLTADTYIQSPIAAKDKPLFSLIQTKSFRYLSSTVGQTTLYHNRTKANSSSMVSSNLFELIEKGSVFYFKDKDKASLFVTTYLGVRDTYLLKAGMNQSVIL